MKIAVLMHGKGVWGVNRIDSSGLAFSEIHN